MDIYPGPRTLRADGRVLVLPDEFNGTLEEASAEAIKALKELDVKTLVHDALASSQTRANLENALPKAPIPEVISEPAPVPEPLLEIIDEPPPAVKLATPIGKSPGDAIIEGVRHEQLMLALRAIQENTRRRSWDFPVVRDASGYITSIRAVPEGVGT